MFFLICFHILNYLRPFWHNIQCIYYITYYTVYLCDIYIHTYARTHASLHARRSVLAHSHIYKQTIRQQNKNDVCLDYPREEFPSICESLGGTHTTVLCPGSRELLAVDACSYQGYEVLASHCKG